MTSAENHKSSYHGLSCMIRLILSTLNYQQTLSGVNLTLTMILIIVEKNTMFQDINGKHMIYVSISLTPLSHDYCLLVISHRICIQKSAKLLHNTYMINQTAISTISDDIINTFGRICLSGHVEEWGVETLAREQYLIKRSLMLVS